MSFTMTLQLPFVQSWKRRSCPCTQLIMYERMEVCIQVFLTKALVGGEWSVSCHGRFTPPRKDLYYYYPPTYACLFPRLSLSSCLPYRTFVYTYLLSHTSMLQAPPNLVIRMSGDVPQQDISLQFPHVLSLSG
jgi:hypothetical protein